MNEHYLIVILDTDLPVATTREREYQITSKPVSESVATVIGEHWLLSFPNDIVMLMKAEVSVCRFCNEIIYEKPGWLVHRWVHEKTRAYTCSTRQLTQATPVYT